MPEDIYRIKRPLFLLNLYAQYSMIKTNHLRLPLVQFIGDILFISNDR